MHGAWTGTSSRLRRHLVVVPLEVRLPRRRADGVVPAEILEIELRAHFALRYATAREVAHAAVHLLETRLVVGDFLLRHEPAVARDQRVEIDLEQCADRLHELDRAAAACVVDYGHAIDDQVARMHGLQIREVDDRVAARVAAAEMQQLHLDAAREHRGLVRKRDVGLARLVDAEKVRADVLLADHVDAHRA